MTVVLTVIISVPFFCFHTAGATSGLARRNHGSTNLLSDDYKPHVKLDDVAAKMNDVFTQSGREAIKIGRQTSIHHIADDVNIQRLTKMIWSCN